MFKKKEKEVVVPVESEAQIFIPEVPVKKSLSRAMTLAKDGLAVAKASVDFWEAEIERVKRAEAEK